MLPKLLLLYWLLGLGFAGNTQSLLRYQVTRVSPEQGLSSTFVRKIVQDPFGFIWAGTQDGLNRFDGKRIIVYTKSNRKNHALAGADIRDLLIDSIRSTIWVITSYGGINGIDYRSGNVWFTYDQQGDPRWKLTLFNTLLLKGPYLYIGSTEGLLRVDIARKVITKEPLPYLPKDEAVSIDRLVATKGTYCWIFTEQKGVLYADLTAKKVLRAAYREPFKTYDATLMNNGEVLLATNKGLRKVGLHQGRVVVDSKPYPFLPSSLAKESFACFQEKGGSVLISNAQLLVRFQPDQQQFYLLAENSSADWEKWLSSVFAIYSDPQGVLWLGCQQGLAYAEHTPSPFYSIYQSALSTTRIDHAYYLYPTSDSILYACAQNGLYRIHLPSGSITAEQEGSPFYHVFHGPRGELIASSRQGAFVFSGHQILPLEKIYPEFKHVSPLVFNSHVRLNDTLWLLGTQNFKGLTVWNSIKGEVYLIQENSQGISLGENVVNGLYLDRRRQVWVLGDRSVSILDPTLGSVRHLTPAHNGKKKYYSIFFDVTQAGRHYYLASYGNGILMLDSTYQVTEEWTAPESLPANSVYKILPYRDSLLLITTNNGLAVLPLHKKGAPRFFFKTDGLHSNTFEENSGSVYGDRIYAGGEKGLTLIEPALFRTDTAAPRLYLDEVKIESADSNFVLTDLTRRRYQIPSNVLQTTLRFVALHFPGAANVIYAYKINELHDGWINLGTNSVLPLIGLQPGTYTLLIKASNGSGTETKPLQIHLVFLPKWYQTWWFKVVVGLLFLSLLYTLYCYRMLQLRKRDAIRKTIASDLHDDVGSTLNSIKIFTHLAKTTAEPKEYLRQIEDSVQQTSASLRDIIWVLDDQGDNVQEWMERVKKFAMPLCRAKGIDFRAQLDGDTKINHLSKEEKRNLLLITKECINNAVKYAGCTAIVVQFKLGKGFKQLTISDNGTGFDPDNAPAGNGLNNMKLRAEQLSYQIRIQSSKRGTMVALQKKS